jgi:hypothetical protein
LLKAATDLDEKKKEQTKFTPSLIQEKESKEEKYRRGHATVLTVRTIKESD